MWVMAGPASTRMLADYGARIVRIESPTRIDTARTVSPTRDGQVGPDSSGLFSNCNAGKFGITLDIGNPRSRAIISDLVRWADVVTESFSPKAMRAWGLDYPALRKIKPDLIMVSSCLMGQTGSAREFRRLRKSRRGDFRFSPISRDGPIARPPVPSARIPIMFRRVSPPPRFWPRWNTSAAPARANTSISRRRKRRCISSALRCSIIPLTGASSFAPATAIQIFAPHGVYPSKGEDRWVAIVCKTDGDFHALCDLMKRPELVRDARFDTLAHRRANAAALDEIIGHWSCELEPREAERIAQARGIAAHAVQNSAEFYTDPQIQHRGHFVKLPHPTYGDTTVEGPRAKLSRTPPQVRRAAPTLGQDNHYVLEKILGYSEEVISEIAASGVLG